MAMLRMCLRCVPSPAVSSRALCAFQGESALSRHLSTDASYAQAAEATAGQQGADCSGGTQQSAFEKRVALPHKVTLIACSSYQVYLQQRWRFRAGPECAADDRKQLFRLANALEYQTVQGLKMSDLLQKIVTEAVETKEQQRRAGADPDVVVAMEKSIRQLIGAMVWFKRAQRPTFEALAQFRDNRTERVRQELAGRRRHAKQKSGGLVGQGAGEALVGQGAGEGLMGQGAGEALGEEEALQEAK